MFGAVKTRPVQRVVRRRHLAKLDGIVIILTGTHIESHDRSILRYAVANVPVPGSKS
jgi:hypothetical protein